MASFFKFVWRSPSVPGYHSEPEPESKPEPERERHFFENQCRVLEEQVSIAKEISSDHAFCSPCALPELQRVITLGESLIEGCQTETCAHKAYLRQDERTMAFEETLKEILWCMSVVFYSHERHITTQNPSVLAILDEFPQAVLGAKERYLMQKAAVADEMVLWAALHMWTKRHKCSIEECGRPQKSSRVLCLAYQIRNRRASNGEGIASRGLAGESVEGDQKSLLWTTVQKSLEDVVQIGKGSFGTVFETKWLGDTYAKKEFDIHCKDFADEVNALAKLNHSHIVKVYAACSESCIPCFFLMEKVAYNLRTLMKRRMSRLGMNPPFSISAGIDLMLQLSEAMRYMNSQGMVHRDLKAENILVNPVDDDSELCHEGFVIAKLADFGLTKVKNEVTSRMTLNTGTRLWMAPEMFGAHLDDEENLLLKVFPRKADVYSYGIVCSEILTGNVPYYNVSYKQGELYKLITDPGNPLRPELPDSCPEILASLIRECWHTDPVERPTFEEISTTLRHFKGLLMIGGVSDLVHFGGAGWRMFTASDQIAELKEKLEETKHGRDGLVNQLVEANLRDAELMKLKDETRMQESELMKLREETSKLLDGIAQMVDEKENTLLSIKHLEEDKIELEDRLKGNSDAVAAEKIMLLRKIDDLEDELGHFRDLCEERRLRIESMETVELPTLQSQIDLMTRLDEQARDQIAELEEKLEETKHARDGLEKQLFEAEQREMENRLQVAEESKSAAEELQRLRFELDNLMLGKSDNEKLAAQLESEKKILEQKVAQVGVEKREALERMSTLEVDSCCFEQIVENNPELTKCTSVDMSSTTPKPRLYNLMHIKSDKPDLSLGEKVLLSQDDIFNFCNGIVPGSARLVGHEKQQLLNFDLLNRFSVHSIGFYGNKMAMVEIFGRRGIVDDVTMDLMREGKLQPGLYGALREETFHLFYWHEGENLRVRTSRKDISCNFIRYLVELCPIVHICLDANGLEASLLLSKPAFTKKVRTQRLKLFVEKSLQNDLKVNSGFEIHLADCEKVLTSADTGFSNEVSSASEVLYMKVQNNINSRSVVPEQMSSSAEVSSKPCPELEYMHHIFDKYATSPTLRSTRKNDKREIILEVLLKSSSAIQNRLVAECKKYIEDGLEKLRKEKGKDFSKLYVYIKTQVLEDWLDGPTQSLLSVATNVPMGSWLKKLVCLIPIQIARAENNALMPLIDGLQIPRHLNNVDALALADMLRFGFYESILDGWIGDIKVISSMGKQSSGKSYLLNHLSGSLLDVAGGRCTAGVWMTMRPTKECLYILLDFEGLGSNQEDMLLSIFNAAVSNITIFNKKDFHLDKETEVVFERFQSGVSLVKEDKKLFKGLFYIGIKDMDSSDVEDLKVGFQEKIARICSKSPENFLTKIYGGGIQIAAMPPFHRPEYHKSINDIAMMVEDLPCCHQNGRSFNRDLKLVLSQMSTKDWSPIDSKRVAYKLLLLNKHLGTAIASGCLAAGESDVALINFDTREAISEFVPINVGGNRFQFADTNVQLAPLENQMIGSILDPLRAEFEKEVPRKGESDEAWHSLFENFLITLANRRKQRVLDWLRANTSDVLEDGDVQKLQLQTLALLADQQQSLSLCSCKCERCFLRCILERSHPGDHSCKGNHRCTQVCTYCSDDGKSSEQVNVCYNVAGHEGQHDCKQKSHTCGDFCDYFGRTSNCNKTCTLKDRHEGDHKCNSRQHMCKMKCSLFGCENPCITPFDLGDHSRHACHEKMCPEKCTMQGCSRSCGTQDHFHAQNANVSQHLCGNEHQCYEQCEAPGICVVSTEVVKKTKIFKGKRAKFEYDYVSEQNGKRKDCCILIPPFMVEHKGSHSHSTNTNVVHFCETRCPLCGYFCNLPMNHTGLHNTSHGSITDLSFVSEVEDMDILDRKYAWGESGMAEMCMMHCKTRGRGHIHLVPCATQQNGACLVDSLIEGARHETCKYRPDLHLPKDELTHTAFWKYIRFEDPCTDEDRKSFAL